MKKNIDFPDFKESESWNGTTSLEIQILGIKAIEKLPKEREKLKELYDDVEKHEGNIQNMYIEREESLEKMLAPAAVIYCALERGYRSIVTGSDWNAIDLIIYLFESGRVFNLRDALKTVDERREQGTLDNSIDTASKEVMKTLSSGYENLTSPIELCSNVLTSLINKNAGTIHFNSKEIERSLELLSLENLYDALQNYSNINVNKISKMVRELKPYMSKINIKYDVTENEVSNLGILAIKAESDVEY